MYILVVDNFNFEFVHFLYIFRICGVPQHPCITSDPCVMPGWYPIPVLETSTARYRSDDMAFCTLNMLNIYYMLLSRTEISYMTSP